jgi:type I restriction-modification system DNA methylase subunit/predicted type IV restriction endonuclease
MACPKEVQVLVSRFKDNLPSYSSTTYNETQLRREFLDPFFEALGWDVSNKQGYAEAYKEVIHEDAVKVGTATKAPDYSFRVGGTRKFFVEAKKPSVNIKDDISPAFQLRRYAWSGKLPLSILTDFEEFAVYDCRIKPDKNDKASVGRILYIRYDEYENRWEEIAAIFSKEAVLKGSFDKYADSARGKKGTSEVDNEFLGEIERWRDLLARSIAIRNPELSQRELNFAVQRTIDRIIFLRICEDRGIEHYGALMALLNGENVYARMRQNFQKADAIYNSGLFHFRDEKGRAEPPDTLTLSLKIDDKPIKEIITNLYYPDSPYEFSVLPADILGQVYEQFLGKVIRLTAGHQAKVEDKPEVKKAGGVFYTPTYIVDYIVKNTVGKLIDGKTPKQIEKLKILDPACGSGTFLIQAYQFLLDYHRDWYSKDGIEKNAKGKEPKLTKVLSGEWRLSTTERKRILLNNIHGVDIDSQAVEVTKLSLLLKVLEGENEQSLAQQMTLWHERALPDLENNIKCGNSLIGLDYYNGVQEALPLYNEDDEERNKINAFDWEGKHGFPEVMKNGGFDLVIGNPPYLKLTNTNVESKLFDYYTLNYETIRGVSSKNLFQLFIERFLMFRPRYFSFIVPEAILTTTSNKPIRLMMADKMNLLSLVVFDNFVFENATIGTTIFLLGRDDKSRNTKIEKLQPDGSITRVKSISINKFAETWDAASNCEFKKLCDKISCNSNEMKVYVEMSKGMVVQDRKNHLHDKPLKNDYPFILGSSMQRYNLTYSNYASYDELTIIGGTKCLERHIQTPRLLIRRTGDILCAVFSDNKELVESTVYILTSHLINLKYLLGVLNSRIITFYLQQRLLTNIQGFPQILMGQLDQLPIRPINFAVGSDKILHNKIVDLVSSMLNLKPKLSFARTPDEKNLLQRQIDATDRRIDELVYELYGLTDEEIKIVEGDQK